MKGVLILLLAQLAFGSFPNGEFRREVNPSKKFVGEAYHNQDVDHFTSGKGYFKQRYFYSNETAKGNSTVFLFVGGDGSADSSILTDTSLPFYSYASQFGAHTFVLEHRFYGKSIPTADFTSYSLQYFSPLQAVNDVIGFVMAMNEVYNFDPNVKWVLFGASYSANLAAWTRRMFPKYITGAVASSAPIQATLDFWQYSDEIEKAIRKVGGDACAESIRQAFLQAVQRMNYEEGRGYLSSLFGLTIPLDQTPLGYPDIQYFYFNLQKEIMGLAQQNNKKNGNIALICKHMQASNDSLRNLRNLIVDVTGQTNDNFHLTFSYNMTINQLLKTSINSPYAEDRLWNWLTCGQLGYLPSTSNNEKGMFGATVPFSFFLGKCTDVFGPGFTATSMLNSVESVNGWFGGDAHFSGTNVVFINGELDPWARISKKISLDPSQVVYVIPGASHAQDFFQPNSTEPEILKARDLIRSNIDTWLNKPPNPLQNVNTTIPWKRPPFHAMKIGSRFYDLPEDLPSKKTYMAPKMNHLRFRRGRPGTGFLPEPEAQLDTTNVTIGFFRQFVNQFDSKNMNTFGQKYFKNSQYARPNGPNFLMIGGEGPAGSGWVSNQNLPFMQYAKTHGATVYQLEHRYYGDSKIGDNNDLTYLSSLQMLYDVAEFIGAVKNEQNATGPWITFGGSYSGAMSLWMREVFPDLVDGAIGSSGPVFAKVNFYEYLMVVEQSILSYSPDCVDRIYNAFNQMHTMVLTPKGRAKLSSTFTLRPEWNETTVVTELDVHYFFSNIFGSFQGGVQYTGDNSGRFATGGGIPEMCAIINNKTLSPLEAVAAYNRYSDEFYSGQPFKFTDNSYQGLVDDMINAQKYGVGAGASLLWLWQTCTEFGYYQTTDSSWSIFGGSSPVNMDIQLCADVFPYASLPMATIQAAVDNTNYVYGSRYQYRGTKVVAPNGSLDPWHALGMYVQTAQNTPYLIQGTAHCADMYPPRAADPPGLAIVRKLISDKIGEWIGTPVTTTKSPGTTGTTVGVESTTKGGSTLLSGFVMAVASFLIIH